MKVRTRIAPSPTGSPHIGTAYTALFNYCFARHEKGNFILRIEDTDRTRLVETSEKEIGEALDWLGLQPDESPAKGGKVGPYRQSERLEIYKKYADQLVKEKWAYYCNCSTERLEKLRKEQQAKGGVSHYDRKCRYDPPGQTRNCVIRFATPLDGEVTVSDLVRGEVKFDSKNIDDQVLIKTDGFPTYHLASVVDDHLMGISHVIRAEEWLSSTPKHVLLYQAFGWELPKFVHLPLLRNRDRSKISKRKNPVGIDYFRKQGYLPEAIINFLALMGWSMPDEREIFSISEMIENFSLERIDVAGPIFDIEKLDWLNGHYIRNLPDKVLADEIKPFSKYSTVQIGQALPLVRERMKKLSDFDILTSFFFEKYFDLDLNLLLAVSSHGAKEVSTVLEEVGGSLRKIEKWNKEKIDEALHVMPEELGWSKTEVFQTIRVAVTGTKASPPLFETIQLIGRKLTLFRLEEAIRKLSGGR